MIINSEKTKLEKGDMAVFNEKTQMISFFRNKEPLFFLNGLGEVFFPWDALVFQRFIQILSDTHGFEVPEMTDTDFFPIIIKKSKCISYRF